MLLALHRDALQAQALAWHNSLGGWPRRRLVPTSKRQESAGVLTMIDLLLKEFVQETSKGEECTRSTRGTLADADHKRKRELERK